MTQEIAEQERYGVFSIRKYVKENRQKAYWLRIGTAFPNADGSINVSLGALPLPDPKTGILRMHMRKLKPHSGNVDIDTSDGKEVIQPECYYVEIDPIWGLPAEAL